MHCPFCQHEDTRVIDSRLSEDGATVRRRRECPACSERFNTFETAELKLPAIVKQDGRREQFDERKLRAGLELALHKRPVATDAVDVVVAKIIESLRRSADREIPSRRLGDWIMEALRPIDQVAFVRFASVYRRFEDVQAFREEIERLEREIPVLEGKQMTLLDEPVPVGEGTRRKGRSA
ncbi:transcriptional regulator NrdR [Pseudofulvimonas gallinarii]|jgi:transcriptional repressor NrdR|uniref:Transcriptional repressor NrdR n=1 Tax=Pseudofulvimonas gallinarii TaxID=634155 RepID=A0A4S3KTI8_9GAMM|nr:transcriptional regulator NrdR [Pseudofulvimonas gallinarii]TCT00393.1 transcriptional repressor NrdR [Pseudofulvimonas gallinarii]THD12346.1 transcriptional regulator NrdR [Pseudofulvimonas gallinarii]